MQTALCVGGPMAGRVVTLPRKCLVLKFPAWPSPERVLREFDLASEHRINYDAHTYRWHVGIVECPFMRIEAATLVHDSMTNGEADRAAFVAALTMALNIKDTQ